MSDRGIDVVVTGLGVVSAIGVGKHAFWSALCAGRSGIVADADGLLHAPVRDFSAREVIRSPHLRRADELSRMIAAAARLAIDDAVIDLASVAPEQLGVVVGSAIGDVGDSVIYLEKLFSKGPALASPLLFPNLVLNAPASYVAMEIGATGVNFTVTEGEASGEQALALAADTIRRGRADIVIAGGGDDYLSPIIKQTHAKFRALAGQRGGKRLCTPYDRERSGIALGQGAAMLVLESAAHAQRRRAHVYARFRKSVAFSLPAPPFDWPSAATRSIPISPATPIDAMIGSANGSRRLDACELELAAQLAPGREGLWLSSVKGAIGEFAAAGAVAACATCLALDAGVVPPLCALHQLDTPAPLRCATPRSESARLDRALTLGLARGGTAIALLFERAEIDA